MKIEGKMLSSSEIKRIEVDILLQFDSYCRKHNLKYYLGYGTLLGAIRHKGFIPWDDDIDVLMPRKDYEKFLSDTGKKGIAEDLITISYKKTDRRLFYPFAKVVNKNTYARELWAKKKECTGIWIDVFALDGFSLNEKEAYRLERKRYFWRKVLFFTKSTYGSGSNMLKKIIKLIFTPLVSVLFKKYACGKIDSLAQLYEFDSSDYVGCCQWGYGLKERMNKEVFNVIEVDFEGYKFFAPKGFDNYLSSLYGNYMELPPQNKRITHNILAWLLK